MSSRRNRRRSQKSSSQQELWGPVPQLPEPEPIAVATDPTMIVRSLGAPPLKGQTAHVEHYLAAVAERAAASATALAAAAGLLAPPSDD